MGGYFSMFTVSMQDLHAPVMSRVEVETDRAKRLIDDETEVLVQEMEDETRWKISEDGCESDKRVPNVEISPCGPSNINKKWIHKFTGNVQMSDEVTPKILMERRVQAVEKRAQERKDALDKRLEQISTRKRIRLLALQQKIHPEYRSKEWHFDDMKNFNFAIVGCSGVGKSTFINSLLGLKPYEHGAAKVSAGVEGTLVMQPYILPGYPFIRLWDVPGGSGVDRPADTYFEDHCLDLFDAVLYLHEGRHNSLQAIVLMGCILTKTPVYTIVTKTDLLVESHLENNGREESKENCNIAIADIRASVTAECSFYNENFCKKHGSQLLRNASVHSVETLDRGVHHLEHMTEEIKNIPAFFVSKNFTSRFGTFDAKQVIDSMRNAAVTRLPHLQPCVQLTQRDLKLACLIDDEPKPNSDMSSPLPFCRSSLELESLASLKKELDIENDSPQGSPPRLPFLKAIEEVGARNTPLSSLPTDVDSSCREMNFT